MIPEGPIRNQISSELAALGGTAEQVKRIGDILFRLSFAPVGHDTEYLLEEMKDDDPLIKRACKIMMEGLV